MMTSIGEQKDAALLQGARSSPLACIGQRAVSAAQQALGLLRFIG
ncbi:hypothetical protein VLK31_29875 [Variovorax sp. H27-G14]